MISLSAATAAISLAQEFDRNSKYIKSNPGSPVDTLNATIKFTPTDRAPASEYNPTAADVSLMSNGYNELSDDQSEHTKTLDALSLDIATFVRNHLNFAKNKVRPIIQALVEEVNNRVKEIPSEVEFSRTIIVDDLPAPMLDSAISSSIEEYKGVDYLAISSYISLPGKTVEEVKQLVLTNTNADEAINAWLASIGDSFIESVWSGVFTSTLGATRFEEMTRDPINGKNAALLTYLICLKLFDNPPEGTSLNLAKYNEYIAELRNQAALRLYYIYSEHTRFVTTGLLIKRYDDKSITVVGDVYRKWIENGGSNMLLYGSVLSPRVATFVADIDSNKDELSQYAVRQNYVLTAAHRNKRFVQYKDILHHSAIKVIGDHFQECFGHLKEGAVVDTNVTEYIEFGNKLPLFIDNVNEDQFKNIWRLCQDLICNCVFYYTDADKILNGIELACSVNPEIDVREAALLSTITYITDYVCDQMHVRPL